MIKPVIITRSVGVINFQNGDIASNVGYRFSYDVSDMVGETVFVTGKAYSVTSNTKYNLYAIYNENDAIIELHNSEQNTEYEDEPVVIPANAKKITVNGSGSYLGLSTLALNETIKSIQNYVETDKIDFSSHYYDLSDSQPSYQTVGLYDFKTGNIYSSSGGKKYVVTPGTICIISGRTASISASVNYNLFGFFDDEMNLIYVYDATQQNTAYSNIKVAVPENAYYCWVNGSSTYPATLVQYEKKDIKINKDYWANKKIGIIGTSVAFGAGATTSYGFEASKEKNFELRMFAVPGLAIETDENGGPMTYGSLTLSKSEYTAAGWTIPDSPITPYIPGGSYNNYYCTWENVFTADNEDIDLWIFACIPNNTNFDLGDWNAFDRSTFVYSDSSSFESHRKTFLGAILFLMKKMYDLNPNARMVFLIDSAFRYSEGKSNLETVNTSYHIPILNLWGNINSSPKSLEVLKQNNGTDNHPTTFAHKIMGHMLAGELDRYC